MTTTADEKLASAKQHIEDAIKDLSEILIDKVWGWDEFRDGVWVVLQASLFELMELRNKLNFRGV